MDERSAIHQAARSHRFPASTTRSSAAGKPSARGLASTAARRRRPVFLVSPGAGIDRRLRHEFSVRSRASVTGVLVEEAIAPLREGWGEGWADVGRQDAAAAVLRPRAEPPDLFHRCQLNTVIDVRRSGNLSAAGRTLFAVSRTGRTQANDADRLRTYLARFGLDFSAAAQSRG